MNVKQLVVQYYKYTFPLGSLKSLPRSQARKKAASGQDVGEIWKFREHPYVRCHFPSLLPALPKILMGLFSGLCHTCEIHEEWATFMLKKAHSRVSQEHSIWYAYVYFKAKFLLATFLGQENDLPLSEKIKSQKKRRDLTAVPCYRVSNT